MTERGKIISRIIQDLNIFRNECKSNSKLNLLNDNIHSENLIQNILNIIFDLSMISLNDGVSNFPGLDLGDKTEKTAFQVTAEKTSKKINKTIQICIDKEHYKIFKAIKIFILSERQKKYSLIDSSNYFKFSEKEDIIDFDNLFQKIKNLNISKLINISEILDQELPYLIGRQHNKTIDESVPILQISIEDGLTVIMDNSELQLFLREVFFNIKSRNDNFQKIQFLEEITLFEKSAAIHKIDDINARKEKFDIKEILQEFSSVKKEIDEKLKILFYTQKYPIENNFELLSTAFIEIVKLTNVNNLLENTSFKTYFDFNSPSVKKFEGSIKLEIFNTHSSGRQLGCSIWVEEDTLKKIIERTPLFNKFSISDILKNYIFIFRTETMYLDLETFTEKLVPSFIDRIFDFRSAYYNFLDSEDFESWIGLNNYEIGIG